NCTNHSFYHADGNGNIMYLENTNQGLAASYRYDAFGETLQSSGPLASSNTYQFSSKQRVQIAPNALFPFNGIYYYGYRFYVPHLQRWLNRDPLGDIASSAYDQFQVIEARAMFLREFHKPNPYLFIGNSPVTKIDKFGLQSWMGPGYGAFGPSGPGGSDSFGKGTECDKAIWNALTLILGNWGIGNYPPANDDDSLQHCITSCRLAKACGKGTAWLLGWLKESNDLIHGGSATETDKDLENDTHGRNCPPSKNCEDYCNQTRGQYR